MSESEQDFISTVDGIADSLEALARLIRSKARRSTGTCLHRGLEILTVVNSGTANMSLATMIKRAVLADEEQGNEPS